MRRGILGGTFDPPHLAHLVAAEAAFRELELHVVTFIPAGAPWQKAGTGVSEGEHRLTMTRLAIEDVPYFAVDDREVQRDGWTYTVDTLGEFASDEQLTLILGADAAAGVRSWHRPDDLLAMAQVAVVPRPGVDRGAVDAALSGADYVWLDAPELAISSTDLRRRVGEGRSLRFLVPPGVEDHIRERGLYREI